MHLFITEYKFDVTVFDPSPLVGTSSSEAYRVYLPWNRRDATFAEIGRSSNTGTGEVGQGYQNPSDGAIVPHGSGLPLDANTDIITSSTRLWRQLRIHFPSSSSVNRIGVFYATTSRGEHNLTIPIIKISETGETS